MPIAYCASIHAGRPHGGPAGSKNGLFAPVLAFLALLLSLVLLRLLRGRFTRFFPTAHDSKGRQEKNKKRKGGGKALRLDWVGLGWVLLPTFRRHTNKPPSSNCPFPEKTGWELRLWHGFLGGGNNVAQGRRYGRARKVTGFIVPVSSAKDAAKSEMPRSPGIEEKRLIRCGEGMPRSRPPTLCRQP